MRRQLRKFTNEGDIFDNGVESVDCRKVLFNCLKNLEQKIEQKVNDLHMLANSSKEMQIKGNKQLIDFTTSVEFLTSKFDELQKERKEKGELIKSSNQSFFLKVEVKNLEKKIR